MGLIWNAADEKAAKSALVTIGDSTEREALDVIYRVIQSHYSCEPSGGVVEHLEKEIGVLRGVLSALLYRLHKSKALSDDDLMKALTAGN